MTVTLRIEIPKKTLKIFQTDPNFLAAAELLQREKYAAEIPVDRKHDKIQHRNN